MKKCFLLFVMGVFLTSCRIQSNSIVEAQNTELQKDDSKTIPEHNLSKKEKAIESLGSKKIDPSNAVSNPIDLSKPATKKKKQ